MLVLKKVFVDIIVIVILSVCEVSSTVVSASLDISTENSSSLNIEVNSENYNKIPKTKGIKKKRRLIDGINENVSIGGNGLESTNFSRKPLRKRKYRKRRRKQKSKNRSVVEKTTEKRVIFSTETESNDTLNKLIEKLNENPEDNFDEFKNNVTNNKNTKKSNRCDRKRGGCSHICHPEGPIECSCFKGFRLGANRRSCFDLNECKTNNGGCQHVCVNLIGSRACACPPGLTLRDDRTSCRDFNECHPRNGHGPCQDTCRNTFGSYECSCERLRGTKLGSDGHTCEDLDECATNNGGCSHDCINSLGRSFCGCPDGMELDFDWKTCLKSMKMQNDQFSCNSLLLPSMGFLNCTPEGRKGLVNGPGTVCRLVCPAGYRVAGVYRMVCGIGGEWEGDPSGKCVDATQHHQH